MRIQLKGEAERPTLYPEAVRSTSFTSPIPKTSLYSYTGMPVAMATGDRCFLNLVYEELFQLEFDPEQVAIFSPTCC